MAHIDRHEAVWVLATFCMASAPGAAGLRFAHAPGSHVSEAPAPMDPARYPQLDGWRSLSIPLVLASHLR